MTKRLMVACFLWSALATPVLAQDADDACELDDVMREQRIAMDQRVVDVYRIPEKAMENAPHVKDGACLPILDQLDGMIRMRIPTMDGMLEGLWGKIKDQVCKMANSYIQGVVNDATASVSDPMGIVGISAGATTGEGGSSVETYDFGKVIERAATKAVDQGGREIISEADSTINEVDLGPDRRANPQRKLDSAVDSGVQDAIRGL